MVTDEAGSAATPTSSPDTPFHDLDAYIDLPRAGGLVLSRDGTRLVTGVQTLDAKRTKFVTALWEIDPTGRRSARRLTRSATGEGGAAFLPGGDLVFVSGRPDPTSTEDDDDQAQLWLLPAEGGEARVVATRPGGVDHVEVAATAGTFVLSAKTFPSSTDEESESAKRKQRKEKKVAAILHESLPVRFWDADLGPDHPRLFAGSVGSSSEDQSEDRADLRDLTPDAGSGLRSLYFEGYAVSPDGSTVATTWAIPEPGGMRVAMALVDVATGERRLVLDDPEVEYGSPVFSPDGTQVALVAEHSSTPYDPGDQRLSLLDVASGDLRDLTGDWDHWPTGFRWLPDGSGLIVTADEDGRAPVFRLDLSSGDIVRLTHDDFAYSDVQVSPGGEWIYAMRTSYVEPARPVRLNSRTPDQHSEPLHGPSETPALPGRLEELVTTAADGVRVRSWLALPEGASADAPAPLLLWIHGGPLGSWNAWSWRWNPWIAVARGYAVLLPDPALSTGYGLDFVKRGWGSWGKAPFTDLMAATDAAEAHVGVDASRTAALGGSFGGYMANWVAGHTDRFDAIVTHASLWALDQFGPTTDAPWYWSREMTPEMALANSPHLSVDKIVTPMLVVHGDRDYRVPIGEALRLWAELSARAPEDGSMPHKFLYFPDENHWVLSPQQAIIWNQTVLAFLDHHVLGRPWKPPELLG